MFLTHVFIFSKPYTVKESCCFSSLSCNKDTLHAQYFSSWPVEKYRMFPAWDFQFSGKKMFCGFDPGTFTVSKDLILPNAAWMFQLGEGGWDFFKSQSKQFPLLFILLWYQIHRFTTSYSLKKLTLRWWLFFQGWLKMFLSLNLILEFTFTLPDPDPFWSSSYAQICNFDTWCPCTARRESHYSSSSSIKCLQRGWPLQN